VAVTCDDHGMIDAHRGCPVVGVDAVGILHGVFAHVDGHGDGSEVGHGVEQLLLVVVVTHAQRVGLRHLECATTHVCVTCGVLGGLVGLVAAESDAPGFGGPVPHGSHPPAIALLA